MKYVFVGDIHGRVEDVERALAMDGQKIFVGDFVDSFNRSRGDQFACLDLVLQAIEKGEARSCFGNHELSYLMPVHRCSGYSQLTHNGLIDQYAKRLWESFEPFILIEPNVLITHAGLSNFWWEKHGLTLDNLKTTLLGWWKDPTSPMHAVGYTRGGQAPRGGTFWCHFPTDFEPVPGLVQIFGHTSGTEVRAMGANYCIDTSRREDGDMSFLTLELP